MKIKFTLSFCLISFLTCIAESNVSNLLDAYLRRAQQNGYSGAVLFSSNGKIEFKKAYGFADSEKKIANEIDTIFDIGSLTKQFTAAAILKLESEKKLSVNDPISKYFSDVPEDKNEITLHHLLTHTSGFVDALGSDEEMIGKEDYLKQAFSSKLIQSLGTYRYSNVGYSILAAVIEKVSGKEYEAYVRDNIFLPAGMQLTGYVLPAWDKSKFAVGYENNNRWGTTYDQSRYGQGVTWHLKGNGGIHSNVEDMFKWYLALQTDRILSDVARKKYFHPHVPTPREDSRYGYGWSVSVNKRKETVVAHNGGNGFFMATFEMIPVKNSVIVVMSNNAPKNTDTIAAQIDRIAFENWKGLTNEFRQTFTGTYQLPSKEAIEISFDENDAVVATINNSKGFMLLGGSDQDDERRQSQYNSRTEALVRAIFNGTLDEASRLSGMKEDEIAQFRKMLIEENGQLKNIEILGSVARQKGAYYLTITRISCEKNDHYRMFIWEGDQIFDVRKLPDGNTKTFEHDSGNKFYASSNDKSIRFSKIKDQPVLMIQTKEGEIQATKIQ